MNISLKESLFVKRLPNMEGAFGYLATHRSLDDNTVIKVINNLTKEKEDIIKELVESEIITGSGYPIDEYRVDNSLKGFIMYYYPYSFTFDYVLNRNVFTYEERLKACIDCTRQLKELHNKGYFLNDIALSNSLIDKDGGHLIDFDSTTKRCPKKTESHYELTLNGKVLRPSYNIDKLKQALTNLSLLYNINFEDVIINRTSDVNGIFSLFKDNRELYNLLYSYLSCNDIKLYFDDIIDNFQDEEKVIIEGAKIYRKILN